MTWDDHDIFDGWGSYPDDLQNCPVFQGCFQAARRFYLLFQQHTNLQRVGETDLFGHRCVYASARVICFSLEGADMLCFRCVYASAKVAGFSWRRPTCSATGVYMLLLKLFAFLRRS